MSKPPNEIWLLIDSLAYGGIETHVLELADGLLGAGQAVRVVLVAKYAKPAAIIARLAKRNIPYSYLAKLSHEADDESGNTIGAQARQLSRAIQLHRPAVIHAHGYKASILSKICKLKSRDKFKQLTTFHAGETPAGRVKWYDRVDRYSAFLSDRNLCVSKAIQRKVPSQSQLVNNFIRMPATQHSTQAQQIAFVGRLSHEKAPDRFIGLAKQFPNCDFHLYGDGDMRQALEQSAPANVTLHGFQADMNNHWPHIALLVITSRFEGLPMSAIEAMAQGIPVLSLDVGALSTLISHAQNGWLAKDTTELNRYLTTWLNQSSAERTAMQAHAKQCVKARFSSEAVIPEMLACYFGYT